MRSIRPASLLTVLVLVLWTSAALAGVGSSVLRGASRGAEKGAAKGAVRGAEKGAAKAAVRGAEKGAAKAAARGAEKGAERAAVQSTARATGRAVEKSAERSAERVAERGAGASSARALPQSSYTPPTAKELSREAGRDARFPERTLRKPVGAQRYTSEAEAKAMAKPGAAFDPGTHFTPARRGPPPSAGRAQQMLGLKAPPERRLTVTLPKGTNVREGTVLKGDPKIREVVIQEPLPSNKTLKRVSTVKPTPPPAAPAPSGHH